MTTIPKPKLRLFFGRIFPYKTTFWSDQPGSLVTLIFSQFLYETTGFESRLRSFLFKQQKSAPTSPENPIGSSRKLEGILGRWRLCKMSKQQSKRKNPKFKVYGGFLKYWYRKHPYQTGSSCLNWWWSQNRPIGVFQVQTHHCLWLVVFFFLQVFQVWWARQNARLFQ